MKRHTLPVSESRQLPPLIADYLAGEERLASLYSYSPDLVGAKNAVKERSFSQTKWNVLCEVLEDQYRESGLTPPSSLEDLQKEGTLTVTTGHQLCLFGGPGFFVYKIIAAVQWAQCIQKEYGVRVLPVFWMASEDHDVAEIDHAWFGEQKVTADWEQQVPSGRLGTAAARALLPNLKETLPAEMIRLLEHAYDTDNLSKATRRLVHELFSDTDLLILDGDDRRLKQQMVPMFEKEITEQSAYEHTRRTSEWLAEHYKSQAHVRDVNLFMLDGMKRSRIKKEGDEFRVDGIGRFTQSELVDKLHACPEMFSPNVILRPVYQEVILPNIMYLGGPGELSYWLQLKGIFDGWQVPMPVVQLRHSYLFIDQAASRKLGQLNMDVKDLFRSVNELLETWLSNEKGVSVDLSKERQQLEVLISGLQEQVEKVDPSLVRSIQAEQAKMMRSLDRIEKKWWRAERRKESVTAERINFLKDQAFPQGVPQERLQSIFYVLGNETHDFIRNECNLHDSKTVCTPKYSIFEM